MGKSTFCDVRRLVMPHHTIFEKLPQEQARGGVSVSAFSMSQKKSHQKLGKFTLKLVASHSSHATHTTVKISTCRCQISKDEFLNEICKGIAAGAKSAFSHTFVWWCGYCAWCGFCAPPLDHNTSEKRHPKTRAGPNLR